VALPSLDTIGEHDFQGTFSANRPFTAHPKVDPVTNEMISFGYSLGNSRSKCSYYVISPESKLIVDYNVPQIPVPVMMHDFAITENFSLILDLPLQFDVISILTGKPTLRFDHEARARIGVLPRHPNQDTMPRWFDIDPCYIYHTAAAWEQDNTIVLFACKSNCAGLHFASLNATEHLPGLWPCVNKSKNCSKHSSLCKFTLNLENGKASCEKLLKDFQVEFPTIHPLRLGRATRWCYCALLENGDFSVRGAVAMYGFVKVDLNTGEHQTYTYSDNCFGGEPLFVPNSVCGLAESDEEDAGFVVSFVHNEKSNESALYIVNAQDFSQVSIVPTPRVPYGFHGKWVSAEQILSQKIPI
jgi:carotenoid cleavage dioxygenase-like enzyme